MVEFLRDKHALSTDIIAVQEPWSNKFEATTQNLQKELYSTVWPTDEIPNKTGRKPARVCFFIHKRINPGTIQIANHSPTCQTVTIKYRHNQRSSKLAIHNVYIAPPEAAEEVMPAGQTLAKLEKVLEQYSNSNHEQIVVGDFNAWHADWSGENVQTRGPANRIRTIMQNWGLDLILEPGTITRPSKQVNSSNLGSTIDLIWGTQQATEHVVECDTVEFLAKASDHLPIRTILGFTPDTAEAREGWNYKAADWKDFREALKAEINQRPRLLPYAAPGVTPSTSPYCDQTRRQDQIRTQAQIDDMVEALTEAIQQALQATVPKLRITPKMRPGWNDECTEQIRKVKQARGKFQSTRTQEDLNMWKELNKEKKKILQRALTDDHRERVSQVETVEQLWKLNKWVRNRVATRTSFMPAIRDQNGTMQQQNEGKSKALQERLFPEPPPADLADIQNAPDSFPQTLPFAEIERHEVTRAINSSSNDKAPGNDGIQNRVLKEAEQEITPILTMIFNASLRLHYWPATWKEATVVILKKQAKKDYHDPKSYRPISLLKTLSKVMEFIITRRVTAIAERHHLLPITHCGGRKSASTEHAIHLLLEQIHAGWRKNKVSSLLLLDIAGAFDTVNHQRLLWNIRELDFHQDLVGWLASFLTGRSGRIRFNEGLMPAFNISTGIPQGSPLSPILWLMYNYKALRIAEDRALITGYIDDTCVLVTGDSAEANCQQLGRIHDDLQKWAIRHGVAFAPQKYELVHFDKSKKALDQRPAQVEIKDCNDNTQHIKPTKSAKYLGVWLDSKLSGRDHWKKALVNATQQREALRGISGSTWGVGTQHMVQLYKATVLPRLMYACSTWVPLHRGRGYQKQYKKMVTEMKKFQRLTLAVLTGAFKSTAGAALDVELSTEPIEETLARIAYTTANRIQYSPVYEKIQQIRHSAPLKRAQTWASPLMRLENELRKLAPSPHEAEQNTAYSTYPWWKPPNIVILKEEEAINSHNEIVQMAKAYPDDWALVYSDGSEKEGRVGTAAVIAHPEVGPGIKMSMGGSESSTIFAAEVYGIGLALGLVIVKAPGRQLVTVFTDNQAAIDSVANPSNHSGQAYVENAVRAIGQLRSQGSSVTLQWIPGHKSISGNETADELAKQATDQNTPRIWDLVTLRTTTKRSIKSVFQQRWARSWTEYRTGRKLFDLVKAPHRKNVNLYSSMPKVAASTIIRARTGAIGLKGYLGSIKLADSRDCDCGRGVETVQHLLLNCSIPRLQALRTQIWPIKPLVDIGRGLSDPSEAIIARFLLRSGTLGQSGRVNIGARPLLQSL